MKEMCPMTFLIVRSCEKANLISVSKLIVKLYLYFTYTLFRFIPCIFQSFTSLLCPFLYYLRKEQWHRCGLWKVSLIWHVLLNAWISPLMSWWFESHVLNMEDLQNVHCCGSPGPGLRSTIVKTQLHPYRGWLLHSISWDWTIFKCAVVSALNHV